MDNQTIGKLIDECKSQISKKRLESAFKETESNRRIDAVTSLLRDAIPRTSLGMYNGRIYFYTGKIYEEITEPQFGDFVYDLLIAIGMKYGDFRRLEPIIKILKRKVQSRQLKTDKNFIVFRNCILNVSTMRTIPHTKGVVQFAMIDFDYDKDCEYCPIWSKFLDTVLPSKVNQLILQQFLGAMFIDRHRTKFETMMILFGNGANGKSVIFETISGILGDRMMSCFSISDLIDPSGERKRNIASINGKRINYSSELKQTTIDRQADELKKLISGEPTPARELYGNNFLADDIPILMVNANVLPMLGDVSEGMKRRFCIIPFEIRIEKEHQNKNLAFELRDEYPAIMNWMLRGTKALQRNNYKLHTSEAVERTVQNFINNSSSAVEFMEDNRFEASTTNVAMAKPFWLKSNLLYKKYTMWCNRLQVRQMTSKQFFADLDKAGFTRQPADNGIYYAVYGPLSVSNTVRKKTMDINESGLSEQQRLTLDKVAAENNCDRSELVYGVKNLADITGISATVIQKAIERGELDGTYTYCNHACIFRIGLVDTIWASEYMRKQREKASQREMKRIATETRHESARFADTISEEQLKSNQSTDII